MLVRIRAAILACLPACSILWMSPILAAPPPPVQQEYRTESHPHDTLGVAVAADVAAAAERVRAARWEATQRPRQLVRALTQLGDALLAANDHAGAEAAFAEALDLVEQRGRMTSPELFEPLRGLGYTMAARGRHEQAADTLSRALQIARRTYGLFDSAQQPILHQLARSLAKTGETEEARRHIKYLLHVGERVHGEDDPDLAPTLCAVGEWYTEIGSFDLAREAYRRAIGLLSGALERTDPRLVEPLRGLARTYTQEVYYSTLGALTHSERIPSDADGSSNERDRINPRRLGEEGENALRRAVRIIEAQPAADAQQLVDTLIQLGDWLQTTRQRAPAMSAYRRAARLIETRRSDGRRPDGLDGSLQPRGEPVGLLGFPVRLWYPYPKLATRNLAAPDERVDETYVQLEFTVTRDGTVTDARVVDSDCGDRPAADALRAIRAARYRPRFVRGEPVDTPGVLYRETFRALKATETSTPQL